MLACNIVGKLSAQCNSKLWDASVKTVYSIFSQIHVDLAIREYSSMLLASFLSVDNKSQAFPIWTD